MGLGRQLDENDASRREGRDIGKPTAIQIAEQGIAWAKKNFWLTLILGIIATAGVCLAFFEYFKPASPSISQTATSANGNATNTVINTPPSVVPVPQPSVEQTASAQGTSGDATNTVSSGQGNATGENSSVATTTGQSVTVYQAPGSVVNFNTPAVPIPPKSNPTTSVLVGRNKFPISTIDRFNKLKKDLQTKKYQGSSRSLNFFLEDNPTFAPGYNELAIQFFVEGQYQQAEQAWEHAIALDPTNVLYYDNLSQARSHGPLFVTPEFPPPPIVGGIPYTGFTYGNLGWFEIRNESNTPVYDVQVVDYAVSPLPQEIMTAKDLLPSVKPLSQDGFPVLTQKISGGQHMGAMADNYRSIQPMQSVYAPCIYGTSLPMDPSILKIVEIEITYSRQLGGKPETADFKFIVRKNPSGQWAWFPDL